jgi:hypothetical protein
MATNNFENGAENGSKRDFSEGGSPFRQEASFSSEDFWAAHNARHGAGSNENLPNISISDNQNGGSSDSNQSSSQNSLNQELNGFLQEFEQFFQQFQQGGNGDSTATNNSPSSSDSSSSNGDTSSNSGQSDNSQPRHHQPTDSTQPSQGGGAGDQSQQGSGESTQQNNGSETTNNGGADCNNSGNNGGTDCNNSGNGGTGDTTQHNGGSDSGTSSSGQSNGGSDTTQSGSGSDSTQSSTSGQSGTDCPTPTPTPNPSPSPSPTPAPPATPTIADQAASVVSQVDNSAQSGDFLGALTTLDNSDQAFKSSDPNDYGQYSQDLLTGIEHTNTSDGKTGADVMNSLTEADIAYNWPALSKPDGDKAYMDPQDLLNDVASSTDPVNKALLANGAANFNSLYGLGTVQNADVANDMQLNEASFAQTWTNSF